MKECAEHLQHPEVLLMEFFESYHLIERTWSPDQALCPAESDELILEPFHESLEISVLGESRGPETLVCLSGAVSPIADDLHPAISRRGLDYVALLQGNFPRLVLGVTLTSSEETPYLLLLRALNCYAELSPPLRVTQIGHELLGGRVPENVVFDLHLSVQEPESTAEGRSLVELSRDLAELFIRQVAEYAQFEGTLGRIAFLQIDAEAASEALVMKPIWEV